MIAVQRNVDNFEARGGSEDTVKGALCAYAVQHDPKVAAPKIWGQVTRVSRHRGEHELDDWNVCSDEVLTEVSVSLCPFDELSDQWSDSRLRLGNAVLSVDVVQHDVAKAEVFRLHLRRELEE